MRTQERGIGTGSEMGLWGLGLQNIRQNVTVNLLHHVAVRLDQKFRR